MASLLQITASPRADSFSTRLANAFTDSYRSSHPQDEIEQLDLFRAEIPTFLAPQAAAKYAVMSGKQPTDEAETAWAKVLETVEHFKRFDKIVLSTGMWNFGIPYRLKQYIDIIVQPGMTFAFSPESGYTGLVTGKPLALILASGGAYKMGNPVETFDFMEPYLRAVFGFIGFSDIKTIRIQGTLHNKPEQVETDMQSSLAVASKNATSF